MINQSFKKLLNSRNLKATSSRLTLLQSMKNYATAIPYSALQKAMASMDRVTLYRNLDTLLEQGIIHQAFRDDNEIYYALCGEKCTTQHHHHDHIHFKCVTCNSVTCQKTNTKISISLPEHEIQKVSIFVKGVCRKCL